MSRSSPSHLRGRAFVLVEAAFIGDAGDGAALVRPLRDLGPEFDTLGMMPASELSLVNMDPEDPAALLRARGSCSTDLTAEAIERIVEAFVGSPLLHVEVRHLGGAAATRSPDHGVLDAIDEPFVCFTFGLDARRRTRSPPSTATSGCCSGRSDRGTAAGAT